MQHDPYLTLSLLQVVTESSPVYVTEPVIDTTVLKVFFGARETYTTLVNTAGVTTRTEYLTSTRTLAPGLGGLGQQQGVANLPALPLLPSYTVVSSPVTRDTVITQTQTEEFRITFRNVETFTTITSTKLVSTQITSFITQTQTVNPLAGLLG